VRQTEFLIKSLNQDKTKNVKISSKKYAKEILWLKEYFNTSVRIVDSKKNKIIIEFSNKKKLDEIINKIINE